MTVQTAPSPSRLDQDLRERLLDHLVVVYGPEVAKPTLARLWFMLEQFAETHGERLQDRRTLFDETDVMLITYADQIRDPDRPPLETLCEFLSKRVAQAVSGLHLLPHYPSTSDDGFAVADHMAVDPALGTWHDVAKLGDEFRLMLDAVVNHASARGRWATEWRRGAEPFADFFIEREPSVDIADVTRPRTSPLFSPVETSRGSRLVWSTFGPDQFDLNYRNPEVLLAMCEVLLHYLANGASVLRLDAIAYVWKSPGTSCVHLPQTHEIIRLWRTMVDAVAPGTLLITETNVPHNENLSYFGNGYDEAHLVYQFPLAPLLLSAFHLADTGVLQDWLATISTPSEQTTFFNFLGSHDGIGLRPAEGLLTRAEIQHLCDLAQAHGGGVSYRSNRDGSQSPYELNTVFFDALNPIGSVETMDRLVDRHLAAQSMLLALAGIPAIYAHALFGSRNWQEGVERTKRLRTINRQKFNLAELEAELDDPSSIRHRVFNGMCRRIAVRCSDPAFHPAGPQRLVRSTPNFLAFERHAIDGSSHVLCVHNFTGRRRRFSATPADGLTLRGQLTDLANPRRSVTTDITGRVTIDMEPYGVAWMRQID